MTLPTLETVVVGTTIRLQATFRDADGVLADPSTVTFRVDPPSGPTETFASGHVHPSTGVYRRDYTPLLAGTYLVQVATTGNPTVVAEAAVDVRATQVVP